MCYSRILLEPIAEPIRPINDEQIFQGVRVAKQVLFNYSNGTERSGLVKIRPHVHKSHRGLKQRAAMSIASWRR